MCVCVLQRVREGVLEGGKRAVCACVSCSIPARLALPVKLNQRQSLAHRGGLCLSVHSALKASAASRFSTAGKCAHCLIHSKTFHKLFKQLFAAFVTKISNFAAFFKFKKCYPSLLLN